MNNLEKIRKATLSAREATKLLKRSQALREAGADGLIGARVVSEAVEKLNERAIDEMDKFIELSRSIYPILDKTPKN